ncbi:MAG: DEAD/DEAH box helicase family protein, partial [Anaerolineae bacterium]|nr:DEAD/DEAH box helicase family protein [Anaerolineae bacterium]
MSNFAFLKTEWPDLYRSARRVEEYVQSDPRSACFHARRTLELAVQWLYSHDPALEYPYDDNLSALLHDRSFRDNVPQTIYLKAQVLRRNGNQAVHSRSTVSAHTALDMAMELRHVLYWLARTYTKADPTTIPEQFDEKLLPTPTVDLVRKSVAQLKKLDADLRARDETLLKQQRENETLKAQLAALQAQVAAQKVVNQTVPDTHDYSEAETRRRYIDVLLREAGWDPAGPNVAEYKVTGMPFGTGSGKVDYVLWGDDGLPLALVEAKRTSTNPNQGKQQAKLYADCLESMHGQRPIIFYTNGYTTYLWDDQRYPHRQVQGFYTKDQLMLLIQRRSGALPLAGVEINAAIVNRYYQNEAIRRMAEHLSQVHRRGLLVMATGSGKTRVAIALVDLLMRAGWVKRVLFLADRSALVRQATGAFKSHLPASNPVNLLEAGGKEQAPAARVVVSTYHTMMNLIDEAKDDGQKLFSVGHFDLVIIDEAHRSVYQKFGAIFAYFDSLLVGLTATPKDDVDRNTYELFNVEDGVPTFAYALEQAIADAFLVPYQAYETPTKFIREGIKYDDLDDEAKAEWERLDWGDSEEIPDAVDAAAINAWLFNTDTVDLILKTLMEQGLKVAGGDRLGKTIIFAKNHNHALFIEERFNVHYPEYKGKFARVIDNYVNYAQSLIDDFSKPNQEPHIAISVDMLDTGIDVPEVVNLVFFKQVRSKTKFWQM